MITKKNLKNRAGWEFIGIGFELLGLMLGVVYIINNYPKLADHGIALFLGALGIWFIHLIWKLYRLRQNISHCNKKINSK